MNIYVLEDDLLQRNRLEKVIKQQTLKNDINYKKLYTTAKPESLLEEIEGVTEHNMYFLDLEINQQSRKGFEVAQQIRKIDPYGTLVFVTTHSELAPKTFAYRVSAMDFIEKDQDDVDFQQRVEACLIQANDYKKQPVSVDAFVFENKYTKFQIPFSDIFYFETADTPHKLKLVTKTKTIDFYGKLAELVKCDNRLVRCHNSFVVNMDNVIRVDKKNKVLYFKEDVSCFVSRRLLKETETRIGV
ncbi:MAG: response regulator transcription factor [Turicibacter sp.]